MPDGPKDDAFAETLHQMGGATIEQLEAARLAQTQIAQQGQALPLSEVLVKQGVITVLMRENIEKRLQVREAGGIQQLGVYRLVKKLGEGGMGTVYLAEDTQIGRKCALKVLAGAYASNLEFLTRFRREAIATGKLNHPNIVMAYTVGEDHGIHFYAMEYCDGEPLDDALEREGKLPWPIAVDVVAQVAEGLHHAHAHGIVHRDIKPGNIFICNPPGMEGKKGSFPEGFVAKVLDLGLSKMLETESSNTFLTQTGTTLGTPHYIAPEQAQGDREIDGRADIYSLGATFYHLVTGSPPYPGTSAGALIMQHVRQPVPNPRDLNPELPNSVAFAIQRMMAKLPSDRYADCDELLQYLDQIETRPHPALVNTESLKLCVTDKPAAAWEPPPAATKPTSGPSSLPYLRYLAGAIVAVLLMGIVVYKGFLEEKPVTQSVAEKNAEFHRQRKRMREEAALEKAEKARREAERRARQAEAEKRAAEEKRKAAEAEMTKALQRELDRSEQSGNAVQPHSAEHPEKVSQPPAKSDPSAKSDPQEPAREVSVLSAIERWAGRALEDDFAADPTTLAKVKQVDDVEGLERTHGLLVNQISEAEKTRHEALEKDKQAKKKEEALVRRIQNTQVTAPVPGKLQWAGREMEWQLLRSLRAQRVQTRSQAERMEKAIELLTLAKRIIRKRLRTLGIENVTADSSASAKGSPYKVYVLKDGTELKAYMAVKMGEQIAIKDDQGRMKTINASDVKEIRDGP